MLGAHEIEVIMRVRVRLCVNACVSRGMRESWQLCRRVSVIRWSLSIIFVRTLCRPGGVKTGECPC